NSDNSSGGGGSFRNPFRNLGSKISDIYRDMSYKIKYDLRYAGGAAILGAVILAGGTLLVSNYLANRTATPEKPAPKVQTSNDKNQTTNPAPSITLDERVNQTTSTTTAKNQTASPQVSYDLVEDSATTLASFGIPKDASYNPRFSTKNPYTIDFKIYKSSDGYAMIRAPPTDKDGVIVYYGIGLKDKDGDIIATGNGKPNELVNLGKDEYINKSVEEGVKVYINAYREVNRNNDVISIQRVASITNGKAKGYSNQSVSYSSPRQKDSIDTILTDNINPTNHSDSSTTSTDDIKYNIPTESAKKPFFAKLKNYFGIDKDTNHPTLNDYQTANSEAYQASDSQTLSKVLNSKVKSLESELGGKNYDTHLLIYNKQGSRAIARVSLQNFSELNLKSGEYNIMVGTKYDMGKTRYEKPISLTVGANSS
ncbi:MAG: hypothetical protein AABY14_00630, partial [Nanoarchaeota archaeon]